MFLLELEEEGEGGGSWGHMVRTMGLSSDSVSLTTSDTTTTTASPPSSSPAYVLRSSLLPFRARHDHRKACLLRGDYSGAMTVPSPPPPPPPLPPPPLATLSGQGLARGKQG